MPTTPAAPAISPAKTREIVRAIRRVVEEEQSYLDPHLTLQDIADRIGTNRTYVAHVFSTKFGGFFNYVNSLRLDYAEAYQKEHPDAKLSEVISDSGFGSRSTYYSFKTKYQQES